MENRAFFGIFRKFLAQSATASGNHADPTKNAVIGLSFDLVITVPGSRSRPTRPR